MAANKKRYYVAFPLIITMMIALVLSLGCHIRNDSYLSFQQELAQKSVKGASNELHLYIHELRRAVRLFADQEQKLIRSIAENYTDTIQYQQLEFKVGQHFPSHFSFTIASKDGTSLLDSADSLVGDGCKSDISHFSKNPDSHSVYVHSSRFDTPYHFDIMVPWGDEEGIFFISFNLKNITQILKNSETIGHSLVLLKNDNQGQIEVTSDGSAKSLIENDEQAWFDRLNLTGVKDNFKLNTATRESIEYETAVIGTLWTLADIPNVNLYSSHSRNINIQHTSIFILFCFVIGIMTYIIYRTNKKLLATMSDLQAVNKQKDKLFSIIGHDLRSPFIPIQYYSNTLIEHARTYAPEEIIKRAAIIREASDRALELLEELLSWAKLHSDGYPITIEKVLLKPIVLNSIDLYSLSASEKGCALVDETEDTTLIADPHALDTIIRNLVVNAIKFTENGIVTIGSRTGGNTVSIYIKDTGQGMDEETCQKILTEDSYYTSAGTDGEKGSGLGLSLCIELASKQNGALSVESVLGEGTTFQISLPKES
ncbi:MAG: hypothetical protein GQ547_05900 [Methylophaga sp.]|nr:hypothetical protein [Methylophaga sp.]